MSITFTCDDKQTLVAYLYGEIDHADAPGGRRAPRARARRARRKSPRSATCDRSWACGCRPTSELDFTIVKKSELPPATVLRPARWWSTVPAWAQAAAAILVLAAGAAIANVQVTSGPDGFSVTHRLDAASRASR